MQTPTTNGRARRRRGTAVTLVIALAATLAVGVVASTAAHADTPTATNSTAITIPASGTLGISDPYPSNIVVAGTGGVVTDVDVTLSSLSHAHPRDLDVLLLAPNGTSTLLMEDVGPNTPVSDLDLTFSDEAATRISQAGLASGTYQPSQFDDEIPDNFPAPAPAGPWGTALSALDGTSPNGTWSLYVYDDAGGDIGVLNDGWSLSLVTTTADAGGPYSTNEGSGITLSGSTTPDVPGATYEWDVDGDGQFDDATGPNPTVSAGTLASIGLGDGPDSSNVRVRGTAGSAVITSTATTLTVTNAAPTATFSNNGPVTLGNTADVQIQGQSDPSSADTTAGFRYGYDFDDDGDFEVGDGNYAGGSTSSTATIPTSILNAPGPFTVVGRIIDKDGGFTDYSTVITVNPPPNQAPAADAGADQTVDTAAMVTLDGTGSSDPDSDPLTHGWVQTAGPAVTLVGANTATPAFTAPTGPVSLTYKLTVCDDAATALCDSDTVAVEVRTPPTLACAGLTVTVNLALGQSPTDGPDVVRGTSGDDIINGLRGNDIICGGGGIDLISGNQGNDRLFGGVGDDEVRGNAGGDILRGRAGDDTLLGEAGNDTLDAGDDTDTCRGGTGRDTAKACEITVGVP